MSVLSLCMLTLLAHLTVLVCPKRIVVLSHCIVVVQAILTNELLGLRAHQQQVRVYRYKGYCDRHMISYPAYLMLVTNQARVVVRVGSVSCLHRVLLDPSFRYATLNTYDLNLVITRRYTCVKSSNFICISSICKLEVSSLICSSMIDQRIGSQDHKLIAITLN